MLELNKISDPEGINSKKNNSSVRNPVSKLNINWVYEYAYIGLPE